MPDSRGPGVRRSRGGNVQLKNPGSLSNRCSTYGLKVLIKLKRIHSEENNNNHMRDFEENVSRNDSRRVHTRLGNGRSLMRLVVHFALNFRKAYLQKMSRLQDLLSANNKICYVFNLPLLMWNGAGKLERSAMSQSFQN